MATLIVPALLRKYTGGLERVNAAGRNVREVIENAARDYPALREGLMEGDKLKPSIAVWVDGEAVVGGLISPVKETSEIHFLPAIGGGS
jgi:sulfur-carrier protein